MLSKLFKRAFAAALVLASLLAAYPAVAAPVSLRWLAAQDLRAASIAYRISTHTVADCPDPQKVTGLLLHDLTMYDPSTRKAVSRAFSLSTGFGVIGVVRGSAAERAGLRLDDEILAVNQVSVQDLAAINQSATSVRRIERFSKDLRASLTDGPAELLIRRAGTLHRIRLTGELGCGGDLSLKSTTARNAWSDGNRVVVTTGMMELTHSDDELAFIVAHELAHNVLGHSRSVKQGIFGLRFGSRRQELQADYMAVWMMTEGGYKAEGAIGFLQTAERTFPLDFSLDHPSFQRRLKTVETAIAGAEYSPVWARAHPGASGGAIATGQPSSAIALAAAAQPTGQAVT